MDEQLWCWYAVLLRVQPTCSGSPVVLWGPCHSVVKVKRPGLCRWSAGHTQQRVPEGPEETSTFQILALDLHSCWIKGFFEFPKFRAKDLVYKVLTLKRV